MNFHSDQKSEAPLKLFAKKAFFLYCRKKNPAKTFPFNQVSKSESIFKQLDFAELGNGEKSKLRRFVPWHLVPRHLVASLGTPHDNSYYGQLVSELLWQGQLATLTHTDLYYWYGEIPHTCT